MKRSIIAPALCLCLLLGLLSGCGGKETAEAQTEPAVTEAAETVAAGTSIAFSDANVAIQGSGASVADDGDVEITAAGVYEITGASSSGRVVVEIPETDEVTLILAGCDLTYTEDEVIYVKTAGSANVILASGTENTLTSGVYTLAAEDEEADAEAEDASGAALRAKCDMTISGEGALTVYGYINNGVAATGDLTIESGSITVTAVNDAVKARGELTVADGVLSLAADGDGMQSDGGMNIAGGEISVTTGVGAADADMKVSDSGMMGNFGNRGRASDEANEGEEVQTDEGASAGPEETSAPAETDSPEGTEDADNRQERASGEMRGFGWDQDNESSVSRKGLKSAMDVNITGGTLTLNTEDDGVHADGNVTVSGGTLVIQSGDDGVHADGALDISGGSVSVSLCYEGLEATSITITDGFVDVIATDDGMNVNGGDFGMMMRMFSGEMDGADETEEASDEGETPTLRITGGTILVDSGGDGLDSNGSIYIEGGTVLVSGPSSDWDAAIDYGDGGYDFIITGGYVMAGGYSGMAEPPDSTEDSQCTIYYSAEEVCADGDTVTLLDADGNVLLQHSFVHGFNCVVLSCPEMTADGVYTLTMGDQSYEIEMTGTSYSNRTRGGMGGFGSREMRSEDGTAEE